MKLLHGLVRWGLGDVEAQVFLSEMEELYRRKAEVDGRAAAERWRRRELRRAVFHALATRFSRSPRQAGSRRHPAGRGGGASDLGLHMRFAVRTLRRAPGFTVVAVLTLALGIGANTAVFSVLNRVVLRSLNYPQPDRLVRLYQTHLDRPQEKGWVSGAAFLDFREQVKSFESLAAIYDYRDVGVTITGGGIPQRAVMFQVSADFFDVYHVQPILGRTFRRDEERQSARLAVLSHRLWMSRWNGDPSVVGTSVLLDDVSTQVVGIMPRGFVDVVGGDVDLWIPLELQDQNATQNRGNHYLSVVGRLRSGVSLEQASAELMAVSAGLAERYPSDRDRRARLESLQSDVVGTSATTLYVLMGAAALVLLIACVNLANLLLSRHVARQQELAIRWAMGSGRARLIQQLLAESLVIVGLGGAIGFLLAYWGVPALLALVPRSLPRAAEVTPDFTLLCFALGLTLFTAVLAGLVPALRLTRPGTEGLLRSAARSTAGIGTRRLRNGLVISQVAFALVLVIGAGLLIRSFLNLQGVDLGMRPRNVQTFAIHLPPARYGDAADRIAFHQTFERRMRAVPGVTAAGAVSWLPVSDTYNDWKFSYLAANGEVRQWGGLADFRVIEGDYFAALGVRPLHGRLFQRTDDRETDLVAIINQTTAQRYYEGRDPLGQRILAGGRVWSIVGVVPDVANDHRGAVTSKVYLSHAQFGDDRNWDLVQVIATTTRRDDLVAIARSELAAIDPDLVIYNARSLRTVTEAAIARDRFTLFLMGLFAAVALSLATVGLYGVLAYSVNQRTREIGIRMALGADRRAVRGTVMRHGTLLAGVGIVGGLLAALALSRLLGSMLFGVSVSDLLTFTVAPVVLAGAAWLAGYIPARRAARVDPMQAIRVE